MIERILNKVFPREDLPFGTRWRLFGSYVSPKTDTSQSLLKRGLPWPWKRCGVYLHKITKPDLDRHFHNHPANFASWIVWGGGYLENILTPDGAKPNWRRWLEVSFNPKERFHRIERVDGPACWTLFFMGHPQWMTHPDTKEQVHRWGFLENGTFVDWVTYRKEHGSE